MGMVTLAQETTTLPEGPTITVVRGSNPKSGTVSTWLIASFHKTEIKMKVDDISPAALRTYLALIVREIDRARALLTKKPEYQWQRPETVTAFVHNMAFNGMFILHNSDAVLPNDVNTTGNPAIPKTRGRVSNKRKRENHPANLRRHAGDQTGTE